MRAPLEIIGIYVPNLDKLKRLFGVHYATAIETKENGKWILGKNEICAGDLILSSEGEDILRSSEKEAVELKCSKCGAIIPFVKNSFNIKSEWEIMVFSTMLEQAEKRHGYSDNISICRAPSSIEWYKFEASFSRRISAKLRKSIWNEEEPASLTAWKHGDIYADVAVAKIITDSSEKYLLDFAILNAARIMTEMERTFQKSINRLAMSASSSSEKFHPRRRREQ
jgi:hypothetical protein